MALYSLLWHYYFLRLPPALVLFDSFFTSDPLEQFDVLVLPGIGNGLTNLSLLLFINLIISFFDWQLTISMWRITTTLY